MVEERGGKLDDEGYVCEGRAMRFALLIAGVLTIASSCQENKGKADSAQGVPESTEAKLAVSAAKPAVAESANSLAIHEAAKCPWNDDKTNPGIAGLDSTCAAYISWQSNIEVQGSAAEAELLALLGDPDRAVRWLAARGIVGLTRLKTTYHKDANISAKLLKQAQDEKDPSVARVMGNVVGRISLEATHLDSQVLDMLHKGPDGVRLHMLDDVLTWNGSKPEIWEAVQSIAKSTAVPELRSEAIRAIAAFGRDEKMCKLVLDLIRDPEAEVAGQAAYQAAGAMGTEGCPKGFGDVLSEIENRMKSKGAMHQAMAGAAAKIAEQATATAPQKQKALSILRSMVETKTYDDMLRSRALEAVAERDPKGRAFVEKFKQDESLSVRFAAERALEKK